MSRVFLFAMLLLPPFLAAEGKNEEAPQSEAGSGVPELRIAWDAIPGAKATGAASGQSQVTSPRRREAASVPRPKMSGSTTGYVDNAIIGSQVRFRFDAGFGNEAADRAEFFYAKCGCYREIGADPKAPGPAPKLNGRDPNTTPFIETGLDYQDYFMNVEYAPAKRFSMFAEIPVRSIQPHVNANAAGIGDVRAGIKVGLLAAPDRYLTVQLRSYFPSGDSLRGLGTDHWSIEPGLLYYQRFAGRAALAAEFSGWHPIGGSSAVPAAASDSFAGDVLRYGFGLSYDVVSDEAVKFAPVGELVGWRVLGGFATQTEDGTLSTVSVAGVDGTNIVNLKIGGRVTFREHHSIYAGYGHAVTKAEWYDSIVRLEYRYAF